MKLLLKNIRENYSKEEKQEEDNLIYLEKLFKVKLRVNKLKIYLLLLIRKFKIIKYSFKGFLVFLQD